MDRKDRGDKPSKQLKTRLDVLLVQRGEAQSRERAQALILAGSVLVNDVPVTKAGTLVAENSSIRLRGQDHPYVSRGALKLVSAIKEFQIETKGRMGLDIGASTGGFTQVLLENGVARVFALDVGHSQLDWKIRSDERVVVIERTNARYLTFDVVGNICGLIVMDVSFISVIKILPALLQFADERTDWIILVKPQFEVGREEIGKGGIVLSSDAREEALRRVIEEAERLGLECLGRAVSPITGTDGNVEFLTHFRKTRASIG